MKRLFWLGLGVGLGAFIAVWLTRELKKTVESYKPTSLVSTWSDSLRRLGDDVRVAIREGAAGMDEREAELTGN